MSSSSSPAVVAPFTATAAVADRRGRPSPFHPVEAQPLQPLEAGLGALAHGRQRARLARGGAVRLLVPDWAAAEELADPALAGWLRRGDPARPLYAVEPRGLGAVWARARPFLLREFSSW